MVQNLLPHTVVTTDDGKVMRVVFQVLGTPHSYLVVKLFDLHEPEKDQPVTFKFWSTKDLRKTMSYWSTKTVVTDPTKRSEAEGLAELQIQNLLSRMLKQLPRQLTSY